MEAPKLCRSVALWLAFLWKITRRSSLKLRAEEVICSCRVLIIAICKTTLTQGAWTEVEPFLRAEPVSLDSSMTSRIRIFWEFYSSIQVTHMMHRHSLKYCSCVLRSWCSSSICRLIWGICSKSVGCLRALTSHRWECSRIWLSLGSSRTCLVFCRISLRICQARFQALRSLIIRSPRCPILGSLQKRWILISSCSL